LATHGALVNSEENRHAAEAKVRRVGAAENPPARAPGRRLPLHHLCDRTGRRALALPHADVAPLLSIAVPVIAVALTVAFTVPRGQRRKVWGRVGFHPRRGRGLLVAVLGPALVIAASFGVATALGVVRFPGLGSGFGGGVLDLALGIVIFTFVLLGEEIGWRGYLLFRLAELTTGRRAALLTGVSMRSSTCHCCCSPPPTRARGTAGSSYRW
jgi:hypothetical protein